jgi:hypothetical protein
MQVSKETFQLLSSTAQGAQGLVYTGGINVKGKGLQVGAARGSLLQAGASSRTEASCPHIRTNTHTDAVLSVYIADKSPRHWRPP